MDRLFDQLATTARSTGQSFWVAWIGGAFFFVDAARPWDAMMVQETGFIPAAVEFGVLRRARWYIAPGDFVLDLA